MAEDKYQYTARKMEDAKKYIERSLHLLFEKPPEYDRITRVLGDEIVAYFTPSFTEGFVQGATDFLNKRVDEDLYDERGYADGIEYAHQVFEKDGLGDERVRKYGSGRFSTQPYEEKRIDLSIGNLL